MAFLDYNFNNSDYSLIAESGSVSDFGSDPGNYIKLYVNQNPFYASPNTAELTIQSAGSVESAGNITLGGANGEFNDFSLLEKIIKFESSRFFSLIIKKELLLNKQTKISEYWLKSQIEILKYAKSTVFLKTHNFCGAINNNQFTNSILKE